MIISLSASNFKAFDKKCEFSAISSSKISKHPNHEIKIKSLSILKYGVIYGANASGKTCFIDIMRFIKDVLQENLPLNSVDMFCKYNKKNKRKKSQFSIRLCMESKFYEYGFVASLKDRAVCEEWLYELYANGNNKKIYHIYDNSDFQSSFCNLNERDKERFSIYFDDYNHAFKEGLFLTELFKKNKSTNKTKLELLHKVYKEIIYNNQIVYPYSRIADMHSFFSDVDLNEIKKLMMNFDTGISDLFIKDIDNSELEESVPRDIIQDIIKDSIKKMNLAGNTTTHGTLRKGDNFFGFEIHNDGTYQFSKLVLSHAHSSYSFDYIDESDGTKRLFDLLPMLLSKTDSTTYWVDEIERSLHPLLLKNFLKLFMKYHKNDKNQLIFTTHENLIMNYELFRRDEFWIVDKFLNNTSYIYPFDKFKERNDKKIDKEYLNGRYGGIPKFGGLG